MRKLKINWKKILRLSGFIVGVLGFFITLGFTENRRSDMACKEVLIKVNDSLGNSFIDEKDVREIIDDKIGKPEGKSLASINISMLEKMIDNNPYVLKSEVFSTLDGKLVLQVQQRRPIVRIINASGENFYIDEQGVLMPVSDKNSARVPVANGNIVNRETEQKIRKATEQEVEDTAFHANILEKIYAVANHIRQSDFWTAQIEQIYVNAEGDMELIPLVGNHTIVFGDATQIEKKFNKLFLFYREGLNKTGWNQYSKIDVRFNDQVVCTKTGAVN
jgi:cell division protein FtsQ